MYLAMMMIFRIYLHQALWPLNLLTPYPPPLIIDIWQQKVQLPTGQVDHWEQVNIAVQLW